MGLPILDRITPLFVLYMEESNFSFRYVRLCDLDIPREKWLFFAHSGDLNQTPHSLTSDLVSTVCQVFFGVSRLNCVNKL